MLSYKQWSLSLITECKRVCQRLRKNQHGETCALNIIAAVVRVKVTDLDANLIWKMEIVSKRYCHRFTLFKKIIDEHPDEYCDIKLTKSHAI